MRRPLAGLVLCATAALGAGPREIGLSEQVSTRLAGVSLLLHEKRPGGCAGVGAESIEILEDGLSVGPVYLAPAAHAPAHALLVDTGPGTLPHLGALREAASSYVASLPAGEQALLATFDHRLLLRVPWSEDRARLGSELAWIEPGAESRLWGSMLDLLDYLADRPGRKALVVLTRGCDDPRDGGTSAEEVARAAASIEALSVFFVGIGVPARCDSGAPDPLAWLREIAGRTGGQSFDVTSTAGLAPALSAIRERLGREVFVTYLPTPFGRGPRDRPEKQRARWRSLRVELHGADGCRASIAGCRERCECAPGDSTCRGRPRRAVAAPGALALVPGGASIAGALRDTVQDAGAVAPSFDVLIPGAPRPETLRGLARERRVEAWLPPSEELRRPGAVPEDTFVHALRRLSRFGAADPAAPDRLPPGSWTDVPFVVNGDTLLAIRRELGQALAGRPEDRAWATERLRRDRLAGLDAALAQSRSVREREVLLQARQALAGGPLELGELDAARYLGAWLGDLPVARVFRAAEGWLAAELLAAARAGRPAPPAAWSEVQRTWELIGRLLPPSGDVRLLAWLVPGYDGRHEVVGYYRVLLAQNYAVEIRDALVERGAGNFLATEGQPGNERAQAAFEHLQSFNYSRQAPLGAALMRWMLEQREAGALLSEGHAVGDVRYAHGDVRDLLPELRRAGLLREVVEGAGLQARQVELSLAPRGADGPALHLGAYFARRGGPGGDYEREPLCLVLPSGAAASPAQAALVQALTRAPRRTPCVLGARVP